MSTVLHWLSPTANPVGLWFYQSFRDCFRFHRPEHLKDKPIDFSGYFQVFSVKFLLEVCAAGTAIWGFSEIVALRNSNNLDSFWRPITLSIVLIFMVRFWWHSKHFLERGQEFPPVTLDHRRLRMLPLIQIFSTKLLLEVFGGATAVWGSTEVLTLRNENTRLAWWIVSIVVGSLFLIRWICQILIYFLRLTSRLEKTPPILTEIFGWFEMLIVWPILRVLGAAAAIWGIADILKLRHAENLSFWRPVALIIGVTFSVRWFWHIWLFAKDKREETGKSSDDNGIELPPEDLALIKTGELEEFLA